MTASVIIINYNYAQYLRQAIDSALAQDHPDTEVIVVDDGSTDASRDIIHTYGNRVNAVFKANGGMGSAWNAGFAASRGDLVFFLDADDLLLPGAVHAAATLAQAPGGGGGGGGVSKVHWPLAEIDGENRRSGRLIPPPPLPEGGFREATLAHGPDSYVSPPTTGNAWARFFLQQVLPMPAEAFRRHSDTFLYTLAPLYGTVRAIQEPQGCYRVHGNNDYASQPADEKNRRNLEMFDRRCDILAEHFKRAGVTADPRAWKAKSSYYDWMQRLERASRMLYELLPAGATFILIDDASWSDGWGAGEILKDRRALPFLERDGRYFGPPPDGATAITEIERMRQAGASHLVFAWSAFWWLNHYSAFLHHLRGHYASPLHDDLLVVFDLTRAPAEGPRGESL
jgi:glycosyltransferase involved in cell wall biosynthesis